MITSDYAQAQRVNYGYIPDPFDPRDFRLAMREDLPTARVPQGSNRVLQYIKNQMALGSCTGFCTTRLVRYALKKLGFSDVDISELMAYTMGRLESGLPLGQDTGAYIRASMDAARKYGIAAQVLWNYANWQTHWNVMPNQAALADALNRQVIEYMAVDNTPDAINAAMAAGYAISLGIPVFATAFENAPLGRVSMPNNNDVIRGYHNIVIDAWNDLEAAGTYGFPNSWGMWGNAGYGTMPYDYVTRFASDLKCIKVVEGERPTPPRKLIVGVGARFASGNTANLWNNIGTYEEVAGIGVMYDDKTQQEIWPTQGPILPAQPSTPPNGVNTSESAHSAVQDTSSTQARFSMSSADLERNVRITHTPFATPETTGHDYDGKGPDDVA